MDDLDADIDRMVATQRARTQLGYSWWATQQRVRRRGVTVGDRHGTNSDYVQGCRCVPCIDAHKAYMQTWRRERRRAS